MRIPLFAGVLTACFTLTMGCAMQHSHQPARLRTPNPVADRETFVEQRATELIRRGAPKDKALGQASSDWFDQLGASDRYRDEVQRAQRAKLDADLKQALNNRGTR